MAKTINLLLMPLFLLLVVGLASAITVTVSSPTTGTTLTNGSNVTLTVVHSPSTELNITNCSVWLTSDSTANNTADTTSVKFATIATTAGNATYGVIINTLILEDASDYVITATCSNTSKTQTTGTETGIVIDNTVPDAPIVTAPATGTAYKTTNALSITSTVTNSKTTTGYVTWRDSTPTGKTTSPMSCPGSTCTLALTNVPDGTYYFKTSASDGLNSTDSAGWQNFLVDYQGKTGAAKAIILTQADEQATSGGMSPLLKIVLLCLVVYFIVQLSNGKKKKK